MNNELKHLDISFNRFNFEEITIIAEKLKANHSILGIHVQGNQAKYDHKGYLHPKKKKLRKECIL